MANPTNQPPQSPEDFQSIQSHLVQIVDQYKEWNKEAKTNNFLTRETSNKSTELNKLLNKALDIESKIGKELVKQKDVARLTKLLNSEAGKLAAIYQNTYKNLTTQQQKQVDLLSTQQEEYKSLTKQFDILDSEHLGAKRDQENIFDRILNLEAKGLGKSQEALALGQEYDAINKSVLITEQKKLAVGNLEHDLNEKITRSYKNQSISSAVLQKANAESAEKALIRAQNLPKELEKSNNLLKNRNFLQQAFANLPIPDAIKKIPKYIEDFGVKGTIGLGIIGAIGYSIAKIVETMFKANSQITKIAKEFSVTKEHASDIRQYFFELSRNAGKFADIQSGTLLSQQDILNAQLEFNKAFGTAVVMSAKQIVQLAAVKDLIGLSEEAMKGLMTYSLGSGKEIQNIDRTILGTSRVLQAQSGIQLNNKQILEESLKITGGIRANFRGNVTELSKAVTQAKLYGTSLENISKTSEYLLDFESSIESELEAELLTGRQLNLERARAASLTGDMNKLMKEINQQAGDFDHFMHYNVIQQNALAKAFGYSRDELSDILFQQKAVEGIRRAGNNEEKRSLTERYQQLVKEGRSQEDLAQILGKDVEQKLEYQSAQERFNKSLERFQDIFSRLFDGGTIEKLVTWVAGIAEHLGSGGSLFGILTNSSAYQSAQNRVAGELTSAGPNMVTAPAVSTGGSGLASTPTGGGSNSGVEKKLDQLISVVSKGSGVYMDSKRVGTAMGISHTPYK